MQYGNSFLYLIMEKKHCPKCNETKSVDEFSRFDKWKHLSKHCKDCQVDRRKETEIYKDGILNTKQGKGYNWLLGYSIIKF